MSKGTTLKFEPGTRFGNLVVEERVPSDSAYSMWLCVCDCGGKTVVRGTELNKGSVRSCGCLRFRPNPYYLRTAVDRFWEKVDRRGPDDCWEWKYPESRGYGRFRWKGKRTGAHRVAYEIANGPIPEGMVVCHRCDNPMCCNPDHLFVGTDADNMRDKASKGRACKGSKNANAALTEKKVRALLFLYEGGFSQDDLAEVFDTTRVNVRHIVNKRTWKHVE